MKRYFVLLLFCVLTPVVFGVEIFVSKTGESSGSLCQAVRVKGAWFMTAAHCVVPSCKNSSCKAEIQVSGEIIEAQKQNIYWLNKARENKTYYDVALINFESAKKLPIYTETPILILKNIDFSVPKILNRRLGITYSLHGEVGQILSRGPVFYGPKNKIIFSEEMGLEHGISGAGVMTEKGEIISVVSAVAGQGGKVKFSVFSAFDEEVEKFLRSHIPSIKTKIANEKDFENVPEGDIAIVASLDNN